MKSSIKGLFVIIAVVMSFVAVQNACAEEVYTVEGTITAISTTPNMITVASEDGEVVDVYGVRVDYLANQYNIVLETGLPVIVEVYEYTCLSGDIKLMATSITVNDVTVVLR